MGVRLKGLREVEGVEVSKLIEKIYISSFINRRRPKPFSLNCT